VTIEIRQLRYAVATADTHSFSRAAKLLNVKQSSLSRRVLSLESRLGVQLFERSKRGTLPTEQGKAFITVARRIVTDVDNLMTTAKNVSYGEEGRLTVGFSSSLMTGNLRFAIGDYIGRYPNVQFDGIEGGTEKLLSGIQAQMIDAAITPAPINETGGTCNGFVPVTYLITPPWPRMRAG
jgi:DNA-binding transcriptional LysR family regulator